MRTTPGESYGLALFALAGVGGEPLAMRNAFPPVRSVQVLVVHIDDVFFSTPCSEQNLAAFEQLIDNPKLVDHIRIVITSLCRSDLFCARSRAQSELSNSVDYRIALFKHGSLQML